MKRICFIGLGIMGKPMAINLIKAGYSLQVYDRNPPKVEAVASAGARGCSSIKEAVEGCDYIITMLPNSPHLKRSFRKTALPRTQKVPFLSI